MTPEDFALVLRAEQSFEKCAEAMATLRSIQYETLSHAQLLVVVRELVELLGMECETTRSLTASLKREARIVP